MFNILDTKHVKKEKEIMFWVLLFCKFISQKTISTRKTRAVLQNMYFKQIFNQIMFYPRIGVGVTYPRKKASKEKRQCNKNYFKKKTTISDYRAAYVLASYFFSPLNLT